MTSSPGYRIWAAACALLVFTLNAAAAVNLRLDDVVGNPGDIVEAPLFLPANQTDTPTTLQLFIAYDPAHVTPATTFYQGGTSPVLPSAALTAAGIGVDSEVFAQGVISIVVFGLAAPAIPVSNGTPLLQIAFQIKPTAPLNISVLLNGLTAAEPVEINGEDSFCTAADADADPLTVNFTDGAVVVGCVPRANAPTGVTATQNRADGVLIAWTPVAGDGAEYRVYRSTTAAFITAEPLSATWSPQTSFLDTTAAAPATPDNAGCACPAPEPVVTYYYYWVVARTAAGCTGDPSATPVQGARSAAKFAPDPATTQASALPSARNEDGLRPVAADSALAVRLTAENALRPGSITGSIAGVEAADYVLEQIEGAGPNDLWLRATPVQSWPVETPLHFTVHGQTVTGEAASVVVSFIASEPADKAAAGLVALDPAELPFLEVGLNAPYRLQPEGVYDAPQAALLPIPAGERPQDVVVYYFDGADGASAWHPADAVTGWLASAPVVIQQDGAAFVQIEARHSAVVQLGLREAAPQENAAAMPPFGWTPALRGDALILCALLLAGLVAAARHRVKIHRA